MLKLRQGALLIATYTALVSLMYAGVTVAAVDEQARTLGYAAVAALLAVLLTAGWVAPADDQGQVFATSLLRTLIVSASRRTQATVIYLAVVLALAGAAWHFGPRSVYALSIDCADKVGARWKDWRSDGEWRPLKCGSDVENPIWDPRSDRPASANRVRCVNAMGAEWESLAGSPQSTGLRRCVSPVVAAIDTPPPPRPPKRAFCSEQEINVQKIVGAFDLGYPNHCPGYVRVDADPFCDYCRVVGNHGDNRLWCTLGTANGLTGATLTSGVIDAGFPAPECSWVDSGNGVPAFSRIVGNNHELVALTPVTAAGIGDTSYRPK